jgi:hypothetical protein
MHQEKLRRDDLLIASYILKHPEQSLADGLSYVRRFLDSPAHSRYHWVLRKWERILIARDAEFIAGIFQAGAESTQELRSSSPFCGETLEGMLVV